MSKLKDQIKQLEKIIDRKEAKKERICEKIDAEISKFEKEIFQKKDRLDALEKARQKRCKHDGEIGRRSNPRDDASFEYWLFCRKCRMDVGHQNHNGSIEYTVASVGMVNKMVK